MLRNEVEVGDVRKRRGVKRKGHLLRAVERNTHDSPAAPHKPHYQPQKAGKRRRRKKKGKTKTRQTEKQHGACPVRERRTTSPTTPFGPRACAAAATATPGLHSAAGEGPPPPAAAAGGGGRGGTARRGWAGGSRRRQTFAAGGRTCSLLCQRTVGSNTVLQLPLLSWQRTGKEDEIHGLVLVTGEAGEDKRWSYCASLLPAWIGQKGRCGYDPRPSGGICCCHI